MDAAFPHVADRLFGRAHAIEPQAFRALIESPAGRRIISGEKGAEASGKDLRKVRKQRLSALVEGDWCKVPGGLGEYFLTDSGVAVIPVMGILSQRFDWLAAMCGWTTYEGLVGCIAATEENYAVKARLLDVESPGGECGGMLDAADNIIAARAGKPLWAVANTYAASAAYAIAGSASRLIVPRLGSVGSIGAVSIHLDQSAYDQAMGLKYTAVFSGERKIDGWEHAPLSKDARASFQEGVDYCRDQFAQLVERQGRMSAAAALATEAAMFFDELAVEASLADAVGNFDDGLAELSEVAATRSRSSITAAAVADPKGVVMTKSAATAESKPETVANPEAPVAAVAAANMAGSVGETVAAVPPVAEGQPAAGDGMETCPECGKQYMPDSNASAKSPGHSMAAVQEMLELCAIAIPASAPVLAFFNARTPLAEVRKSLAARAAQSSNEIELDPVPPRSASGGGWDEVTAKVNKQFGIQPKQ